MREGWFETTIGEQVTLQRGFDITKKQQVPGEVPVISSGGISSNHNDFKVHGPGVILGRKGSLGTVFYSERNYWPHDTTLWVKDFKKNNPKFVYYFFLNMADTLKSMDVGAANPALNRNHVHPIEITWPDRLEQDRIVEILSSLDNKIDINNQINTTLEVMTQALFKSWFVDFDPVKAKIEVLESGGTAEEAEIAAMGAISGKSAEELKVMEDADPDSYAQLRDTAALFPDKLVESELGLIPEGWEVKSLDELAHYQNGLALQKFRPEDENDFLPVLKIAQLKKGTTDGAEKASPKIKPECIVANGDLIFSWSGSLFVDIWCGGPAALNQHLFKVTSVNYPKWLYYYYTKHHLQEFIRIAAAKAVTMGHIKRVHLSQARSPIPKIQVIESLSGYFASHLDLQIENRLEISSLSTLRDELLSKLFSSDGAVLK